MTPRTFLELGRVSNLPTVWTNALVGAVLAGGGDPGAVVLAGLALTCLYLGGMWLNDAFDAEIDAEQGKSRPIPRGDVSRRMVATGGAVFLLAGVAIAALASPGACIAAAALAVFVILYDWLHKRTPLATLLMGATRFLAVVTGALAAGPLTEAAFLGAAGLFAWVTGLTFAARQEGYDRLEKVWPLGVLAIPLIWSKIAALMAGSVLALVLWLALAATTVFAVHRLIRRAPGDVPRAVVTMIAGISLYDATLAAAAGAPLAALLAAAGFAATLALQRLVSGT